MDSFSLLQSWHDRNIDIIYWKPIHSSDIQFYSSTCSYPIRAFDRHLMVFMNCLLKDPCWENYTIHDGISKTKRTYFKIFKYQRFPLRKFNYVRNIIFLFYRMKILYYVHINYFLHGFCIQKIRPLCRRIKSFICIDYIKSSTW